MIRLLSVRVRWHWALLAWQSRMTSPPWEAKELWTHTITRTHNIAHINCRTCTSGRARNRLTNSESSAGYHIKIYNMKVCLHPNPEMWSLEAVFMAPLFIFGKFQTLLWFLYWCCWFCCCCCCCCYCCFRFLRLD